ncbi:MAG TPA: AraC family transcriptional regulator [Polyangiaceae bacterium]|nr:AraC family transcriptional regulator [Polyangiaceae bacterium]
MATRILAEYRALTAIDFRCEHRKHERPFTEVHAGHSISYVRQGSFGYSSRGRAHLPVAGSLVVGFPGDEFVCSHEHATGDECLWFRLEPALVDSLGGDAAVWRVGVVPPLSELVVLGELGQAIADGQCDLGFDEAAMMLTARFIEVVAGQRRARECSPVERRRAVEAALFIDAHCTEELSLEDTARHARISPFHFLRTFGRAFGVTPHQYLVRSRLRRAARLLPDASYSIASIALEVGFNDISNFVRTFRRAAGLSPSAFRRLARRERDGLGERLVLAPRD